jgi:hypothetical protein
VARGLGHLHEFDEFFTSGSCFYEDGLIGFDTVEIATSSDYEEEEEDTEEED